MARSLVARLGSDCAAAAAIAAVIDERRNGMIDFSTFVGLPRRSLERVSVDFEERGWLIRRGKTWYVPGDGMPRSIPSFLSGMAAMREPAAAEEAALTAVTLPWPPSAIAAALPATGLSYAALISTDDAMRRVADAAVAQLTVMTPFMNQEGLGFAVELFERSPARAKSLVVRGSAGTRSALAQARQEIERLNLRILDCFLPGTDSYETSHAKVVLADDQLAYVGSANLLGHLHRSLELGNVVRGSAARVVASVVQAVEAASRPWNWPP
jgi:hypothetical protein